MFHRKNLNRMVEIVAVVAAVTVAQGQYQISWFTVDGGGATTPAAGGTYSVAGTIGQPDAGPSTGAMAGGTFALTGGFWSIATPTCPLPADLNLDASVNGIDVQGFVNCLLGVNGTNCQCADLNGDSFVDATNDLPLFVTRLLQN